MKLRTALQRLQGNLGPWFCCNGHAGFHGRQNTHTHIYIYYLAFMYVYLYASTGSYVYDMCLQIISLYIPKCLYTYVDILFVYTCVSQFYTRIYLHIHPSIHPSIHPFPYLNLFGKCTTVDVESITFLRASPSPKPNQTPVLYLL